MKNRIKLGAIGVVAAVGLPLLAPSGALAATGPTFSATVEAGVQTRGPIMIKTFWSAILRLFITISRHASQRMVERGISQATVQRILNDGQVISRHNGVTSVRQGGITVRVNSSTGNVITVIRAGGGGGGGGV